MQNVQDYVVALTNFYGLVHKDKVVEIYNLQNDDKIADAVIDKFLANGVKQGFVEVYGEYFVHEVILEFDEFYEQLAQRRGKPHYIPEKEQLLKYTDDYYYEKPKQYYALLEYATRNLVDSDEELAEELLDDLVWVCHDGYSIDEVFRVFDRWKISFNNESQVSDVVQLVVDLANNTRIWENNGYTPSELFNLVEKRLLGPLPDKRPRFLEDSPEGVDNKPSHTSGKTTRKIGRNEPCPCGSGKKYKKCCLKKDHGA